MACRSCEIHFTPDRPFLRWSRALALLSALQRLAACVRKSGDAWVKAQHFNDADCVDFLYPMWSYPLFAVYRLFLIDRKSLSCFHDLADP
jgi:hypothetical protein